MKKLITVLTIMVILVGAVFATTGDTSNGTAVIDIKVTISNEFPTFRLKATTITSGSQASGYNDYSDVASSNPTHGRVELTTNMASDTAKASIVFTIYQTSNTRGASNYYLKVKATDLTADHYATLGASSGLDANEKFEYALGSDGFQASDLSSYGVTVTKKATSDTGFSSADGGFTVVNSASSYLVASSANPIAVGTVAYEWSGHANAVSDTYSATVTLTVEAY